MLGRWFQNEVNEKLAALGAKLDALVEEHVKKQIEAAERITKLEGEIRAMKARAGKSKE